MIAPYTSSANRRHYQLMQHDFFTVQTCEKVKEYKLKDRAKLTVFTVIISQVKSNQNLFVVLVLLLKGLFVTSYTYKSLRVGVPCTLACEARLLNCVGHGRRTQRRP